MAKNTLDIIIKKKAERLNDLKKTISIESLKDKIGEINTFINFKEKIEKNINNNKISLIAEIKKASPSAGIIMENYNPVDIAEKYYNNKATCLSVLTEEDFFLGNLIHIHKIKQKINLPILCKDFFIDPFQVHLAKSYGADAILIILAAVTQDIANKLYEDALKLDMTVIVEVHTRKEAKSSINFNYIKHRYSHLYTFYIYHLNHLIIISFLSIPKNLFLKFLYLIKPISYNIHKLISHHI